MKNCVEIEALLISEVAGTITFDEKIRLDELVNESSESLQFYEQLKPILLSQNTDEKISSIPSATSVLKKIKRRQRTKVGLISITAVACLIGTVTLTSTLFTDTVQLPIVKSGVKAVQLKVGNETINLNGNSSKQILSGLNINTSNNILKYTVKNYDSQLSVLKVPAGMSYSLILNDGSRIMLNSASELAFPTTFTGNTREVTIKGEAYMEIAKVSNKPFIVHMPKGMVQVLGTAFNVNSYDIEQIMVSLVEGAVKINKNGQSVTLHPGKEAVYQNDQLIIRPFVEDDVLSWREGIYNFDNTPIIEIAKVIQRYFGVSIVIDASAGSKRFFGSLDRNRPCEQFLENLRKTNDIDYYIKDDVIHLK